MLNSFRDGLLQHLVQCVLQNVLPAVTHFQILQLGAKSVKLRSYNSALLRFYQPMWCINCVNV